MQATPCATKFADSTVSNPNRPGGQLLPPVLAFTSNGVIVAMSHGRKKRMSC
jgi:hypothetical protein